MSIFSFPQAIKALTPLSESKPGLDALFRSDLFKELKDVMATSDIVRYRIYEVRSISYGNIQVAYISS